MKKKQVIGVKVKLSANNVSNGVAWASPKVKCKEYEWQSKGPTEALTFFAF